MLTHTHAWVMLTYTHIYVRMCFKRYYMATLLCNNRRSINNTQWRRKLYHVISDVSATTATPISRVHSDCKQFACTDESLTSTSQLAAASLLGALRANVGITSSWRHSGNKQHEYSTRRSPPFIWRWTDSEVRRKATCIIMLFQMIAYGLAATPSSHSPD